MRLRWHVAMRTTPVVLSLALEAILSRLTSALRSSLGEDVACLQLRDTHVQHPSP